MSAEPTILDAIDLATRAAVYRQAWVGNPDAYYLPALVTIAIRLEGRAKRALTAAVMGTPARHDRDLAPEDVRLHGEVLAIRVEVGLDLIDGFVREVSADWRRGDMHVVPGGRASCTPEHDGPAGYLPDAVSLLDGEAR